MGATPPSLTLTVQQTTSGQTGTLCGTQGVVILSLIMVIVLISMLLAIKAMIIRSKEESKGTRREEERDYRIVL